MRETAREATHTHPTHIHTHTLHIYTCTHTPHTYTYTHTYTYIYTHHPKHTPPHVHTHRTHAHTPLLKKIESWKAGMKARPGWLTVVTTNKLVSRIGGGEILFYF